MSARKVDCVKAGNVRPVYLSFSELRLNMILTLILTLDVIHGESFPSLINNSLFSNYCKTKQGDMITVLRTCKTMSIPIFLNLVAIKKEWIDRQNKANTCKKKTDVFRPLHYKSTRFCHSILEGAVTCRLFNFRWEMTIEAWSQ